jgi:hypothetical protein
MALNKDFIPEADWKFQAWLSNFVCQIAAVGPAHYRIPEESFNKIKAEAGDFDHKFLVAVTPETRTKAAVQAKTTRARWRSATRGRSSKSSSPTTRW